MKGTVFISGKIGTDSTLVDVIRQVKSFENPESIDVYIHSQGGSVDEGEKIYSYLKTLDSSIPVTTITDKAYSIAAKIYAAGSSRIVESVDKAIMIHLPFVKVEGGAEKLEAYAEALRTIEKDFSSFYSGFLSIDESTVTALLEDETFISGESAIELGFATELKAVSKAVAEYNISNSNSNKMDKKQGKLKAMLASMLAFLDGGNEEEILAQVTLQDSNGTEIVFTDLEEGGVPSVGDKATIDGAAIPDGSYIMPSLEEATVIFSGGAIESITPKETEEPEAEAGKNPKIEKPEVKAEEINEISVWAVNVINTTFAEGDVVQYQYDDETYPVSAGEFQLSDGRRIITDASGVIVKIKESEAGSQPVVEETAVEAEASFEDLLDKVTKKVKEEVTAELKISIEEPLQKKLDEKEAELKKLKAQFKSKEFKAEEHEEEIPAVVDQNENNLTRAFRKKRN